MKGCNLNTKNNQLYDKIKTWLKQSTGKENKGLINGKYVELKSNSLLLHEIEGFI